MDAIYKKETKELLEFIKKSPTAYHAVRSICDLLKESNGEQICEAFDFDFSYGKTYYITRSMTSIIAFRVPKNPKGFMICASHTDSPTFKLKPSFEKSVCGKYITLDVEKYGGMIHSTWLDRPLSVAGRITVREENRVISKLLTLDRDLLVIPNVCIHFNRSINDGGKYNPQTDLSPLYAEGTDHTSLIKLIAEETKVRQSDILSHELFLYDRTPGCIWGSDGQFFSSTRIDDIACAYTSLKAFLKAEPTECVQIYASLDNEETGSMSRQGAHSTFLYDVLNLICSKADISNSNRQRMINSSLMVSADNAHALHPCHPEYCDQLNAPVLNGGVAIKTNAAQRYVTDAVSASLFKEICRKSNVPTQSFANRSDIAGGSTLGNILTTNVPICAVDIGMPQLAMHSAWESAGVKDVKYMTDCLSQFYMTRIICLCDGSYEIV